MDPITILIGLASTILGGAIVVLFQVWIEHKKTVQLAGSNLPSSSSFRSNLPNRDYAKFIGRQNLLKNAMRLLDARHRIGLITIDGVGGIGKTTLALEAAHLCRERKMFDVIIWISAKSEVLTSKGIISRQRTFSNFDDLFVTTIGILDRPALLQTPDGERLSLLLQVFSQERILLVLDNFEVINDEQINEFLRELPTPSKGIVTTRRRINVAYEIRLSGMSLDESLFLMRQESEKRSLPLEVQDLKKLYNKTGGIPLAMVWSVSQISGKGRTIDAVLESLSQPQDDICQYCFQESFQLLSTDEREVLFALSLLDGPKEREAIGRLAGLEKNHLDRDEALTTLVELSLVSQDGDSFDMLSLTKLYTRSILEQSPMLEQRVKERWVIHALGDKNIFTPLTIYFSVHVPGGLQVHIRELVQKFNNLGTGIYAIPIFTGRYDQTRQLLRQALTKGPVPDIAVVGIEMWLEMASEGLLLPLDNTFLSKGQEDLIERGFDKSFLSNTMYKGKTYAIPLNRSLPTIYYNKKILSRSGIDDLRNPPLKWADLIDYAKTIHQTKAHFNTNSFFPIGLPINENWFFSSFTRQAGGWSINDIDFAPRFSSPECIEALNFWVSLCRDGLAKPDELWSQVVQDFIRGQSAILYYTSGGFPFLTKNTEFEVGIWPLPYLAQPAVEIGGANFVILANIPDAQKRAAWQFINWFTQPEQNAEWAIATGYLPIHHQDSQAPRYKEYIKSQPSIEIITSQRDHAYPHTSAPYYANLLPHLFDAIGESVRGNRTPKDSLAQLQEAAMQLASNPEQ